MNGLEDIEDDIELVATEQVQIDAPRKLSRLRKGGNKSSNDDDEVKGIDTPEGEARSSLAGGVLADGEVENRQEISEAEALEEEEQKASGDGNDNNDGDGHYWDEEDEIEEYFKRKSETKYVGGGAEAESSSDEDSDSEEEDNEFEVGVDLLGEGATLDDINAETQRILRETAARDRLGKGQKIEVKPLTGIVAKLRERRALAIARAPKLRAQGAPSFDDALALATEQTLPSHLLAPTTDNDTNGTNASTAHVSLPQEEGAHIGTAITDRQQQDQDLVESDGIDTLPLKTPPPSQIAPIGDTMHAINTPIDVDTVADDIQVLSDDDAGADDLLLQVVDLPQTAQKAPKPSPLAYTPYNNDSKDLDEFEDEPLIDDGLESEDDSDNESERSWEVKQKDVEAGEEVDNGAVDDNDDHESDINNDGEDDGSDEDDNDDDMEMEEEDVSDTKHTRPTTEHHNSQKDTVTAVGEEQQEEDKEKKGPPSAAALLAASDILPKQAKRVRRKFFDMEAELSDEDGDVSEDEDEDDLDDDGKLADLIADHDKAKAKDQLAAEELHVQWARQQDVKELHQVLRGLENGFRRRPGAGLFDGKDTNGEINGRFRRARGDGDDDDDNLLRGLNGPSSWPSAFRDFADGGVGDNGEEECEDEAMLNRAKQQRLLSGSQARRADAVSPGAVPLDEDSRHVLGLLARSQSQHECYSFGIAVSKSGSDGDGGSAAAGSGDGVHHHQQQQYQQQQPSSRSLAAMLGSDPGAALLRAPSFLGRQTTTARAQSTGVLGLGGSRSFVFGRSENSNHGALPVGGAASQPGDAPVNFANLRQMTGITPASAAAVTTATTPFNNSTNNAPLPSTAMNASHKALKNKKRMCGGEGRGGGGNASTLVSRLKNNSMSSHGSGSQETIGAVYQQVVMGPGKTKRMRT